MRGKFTIYNLQFTVAFLLAFGFLLLATPALAADPTGYHDGVDNNNCRTSGWAYDPDVPSSSIVIHIYRDGPAGAGGTLVGEYNTDVYRSDVNSAYGISGNHGFDVALTGLNDGQTHSLYVYGINNVSGENNPLLYNSPINITCPTTPAPTASYTRADGGTLGQSLTYSFTATGNNLDRILMYRSPKNTQVWTQVGSTQYCNGSSSCNITATWTPNTNSCTELQSPLGSSSCIGDWYVVVNVYDRNGKQCTGNPWMSYPDPTWTDCSGSSRPSITVTPAIPTIQTSTCASPGTQATIGWSAPSEATSYNVRVDNKADTWTGSCPSTSGPNDFCLNGYSSTSNQFTSNPGATYDWWVEACKGSYCSPGIHASPNLTCYADAQPSLTFDASCSAFTGTSQDTNVPNTPVEIDFHLVNTDSNNTDLSKNYYLGATFTNASTHAFTFNPQTIEQSGVGSDTGSRGAFFQKIRDVRAFALNMDSTGTRVGNDPSIVKTLDCSTNPGTLTISNLPSCQDTSYTVTLNWQNSGSVMWADISPKSDFSNPIYHKDVSYAKTTTAPDGFNGFNGTTGSLTLSPNTPYYWRLWNGATYFDGPLFSVASCPPPPPPPPPAGPPPPPPPPAPTTDCGSSTVARADGLVSALTKTDQLKFPVSQNGRCIINTKTAFSYQQIPTYADLKSSYYTQSKITPKPTITSLPASFSADGLYQVTGDLTVSSNPTGSGTQVIFVDGNLNFASPMTQFTYGNNTNGIVFVVQKDVNIAQSVTRIDAVIIAEGTICTAADFTNFPTNQPTCPVSTVSNSQQLLINGSFITLYDQLGNQKPVKYGRSLSDNTCSNCAAEKIIHQPKYLVILKDLFADTLQKWSEIP